MCMMCAFMFFHDDDDEDDDDDNMHEEREWRGDVISTYIWNLLSSILMLEAKEQSNFHRQPIEMEKQ